MNASDWKLVIASTARHRALKRAGRAERNHALF
jgi:hypothetical protein